MYNVFIPSRGRWESVRKITRAWHDEGFKVHWVVEPQEHDQYFDAITGNAPITPPHSELSTFLHMLPRPNRGIAASRNHCVTIAASYGMRAMVLADDDIKPGRNANMQDFQECAKHRKVMGITARYSYHDLCLGDKIKDRSDLILLPTGTFRLVALNVDNVIDLGNYDKNLMYAEDCDLFLRSLRAGYPWMIHLGTWSNSVGARYQPGGMLDFAGGNGNLKEAKEQWHEDIYMKWPEFVNSPERADFSKQNSIRISWRKAYNTLMPDWQKWSALHGGYLAYYFGVAKPQHDFSSMLNGKMQ